MYSPQIVENYQLQSGEGLSVFFVLIWLVGDLCNLFGAILSGLLPTVKILATYASSSELPTMTYRPDARPFSVHGVRLHPLIPDILLSLEAFKEVRSSSVGTGSFFCPSRPSVRRNPFAQFQCSHNATASRTYGLAICQVCRGYLLRLHNGYCGLVCR